jgi:hypothetical protein
VRCEDAQLALSEEMDDAVVAPPEVREHVEGCARCQAFSRGAWRLRELTRIELAPPVPDLVSSVMARVSDEEADRILGWAPKRRGAQASAWLWRERAVAMALVAGLVIGAVLTAGGFLPNGRTSNEALASEIPHELVRAAIGLHGYRATFDMTELNWTKLVPRRTFTADVAFLAPEGFRVQVHDTSEYPSQNWPRNDLLLVTDGRAWTASGSDPCPAAALPACPRSGQVVRSTVNRAPFDPQTATPTDVVVPMTVLASTDRVAVIGPDPAAGRDAVAVELAYQDAGPLFDYFRFLGSWRPFFPQDRVVIWLDRKTWFPLQYEVFPADGPERALWAAQVGLPVETSGTAVFVATVRALSTQDPPKSLFLPDEAPNATDERFADAESLPAPATSPTGTAKPTHGPPAPRTGPIQPADTQGLSLYRFGTFPRTVLRPYSESVLAYANGLGWLTVTHVTGWVQKALFGVGPFAEEVTFPSGRGVGYYEPAMSADPRRLSLHTNDGEFLLATNLPRATLLAVAGSLEVTGRVPPESWSLHRWPGGSVRSGLTPATAISIAKFTVLVPTALPAGYSAAAAQTVKGPGISGISIVYRRPGAELDGVGLLVYQATGQTIPPPSSAADQVVTVRGAPGRWSPENHVLEWVENGVYRSLFGPSFGLTDMLDVANSMETP